MTKVTVLGCGPAGLLAAQGAYDAGADVKIVSTKVKSRIAGAQFIHAEIPGLGVEASEVHVYKRGTAEGYAKKVYGLDDRETSWYAFENNQVIPAWSMARVYEKLWRRWSSSIISEVVTFDVLDTLESGDYLISSIPAHELCLRDHIFEANEVGIKVGTCSSNRNTIFYNGDPKTPWHRTSFLFGSTSTEYPLGLERKPATKGPPIDLIKIQKPQWNDCDCRPRWMRVGRYGKWTRGVLAHEAYFEVRDALHRV